MVNFVKSIPRKHAFKIAARAIKNYESGRKAMTGVDSEFTHIEFDDQSLKPRLVKSRNLDLLEVFDKRGKLLLTIRTYIPNKKVFWIFEMPREVNTNKGPLVVELEHARGYETDIHEKPHMKRLRKEEKLASTTYYAYYAGGAAVRRPIVKVSADTSGAFVEIG